MNHRLHGVLQANLETLPVYSKHPLEICILCVRVKINWISSLALCGDYRMMRRVHGGDDNHDDGEVEEAWGRADGRRWSY